MHSINLGKYDYRTDLIIEKKTNTTNHKYYEENNILIDTIIDKDNTYITISYEDITDKDNYYYVENIFIKELKSIIKNYLTNNTKILIIGLGNSKSTPDSLGPEVINNILVTRHLFALGEVEQGYRNVCSLKPQVTGVTGIETSDMIESIINKLSIDLVIVIDALAASSISRVNKTIQITDTGIHPGSGVGNNRKEISKEVLGIPVIAIGVPTVVDASTIVNDTINYLFMHLSYLKDNYDESKLIVKRFGNYLEKIKNNNLNEKEKELIGGIIGNLCEDDKKKLINEVLDSVNYNLIVTPKEIDFLIDKLSDLISSSINNALHNAVDNY